MNQGSDNQNFRTENLLKNHEACRVMTKLMVISWNHPQTNNRFFFLLTIKYRIFIFQKLRPEVPEYAEMGHNIMTSL